MPRSVLPVSRVLLFACVVVLAAGCSRTRERATIKGKVTFLGKNLTVGNVMFIADDNATGSATIDKDGNYVIADAPVGEVKVTVSVPSLPPGGLDMMRRMKSSPGMKGVKSVDPESGKSISIMGDIPANIVPIPTKYADSRTSGLTYTVKPGEHTFDMVLTP